MKRYKYLWVGLVILLAAAGFFWLMGGSEELIVTDGTAGLNGSFEAVEAGVPVNWAFGPHPAEVDFYSVHDDTAVVSDGEHALRFDLVESPQPAGCRSRQIPVEAGQTVQISFDVKTTGCRLQLNRILQDSTGMQVKRADTVIDLQTPSADWQTLTDRVTVAEGEASLVLIFLVEESGSLWLDNVTVETLTP